MQRIPLIKPFITQEVKDEVCKVLDSRYLTEGKATSELETAFIRYTGSKYGLAVCNCTVGLEMALRAVSIGPGDEVILPGYTYPATASVVNIVGATSVIVDIDHETMLIDYDALEEAITHRTKAVIPVSLFGNPLDYGRLNKIKEEHRLFIVEDAACSIGASYDGLKVGNLADISVFSLHPRKFITTGEGGIVTTNNTQWAEWMQSYKHFGMAADADRSAIDFVRIGTNYKLSNIQAAVGLVQMRHIDRLLARRRELSARYRHLVEGRPDISLPKTTPNGRHSYQSCCIFVENRDQIIQKLKEKNIETQIGSYALHRHNAFNSNLACRISGPLAQSQFAFDHCLVLPVYHDMTTEEQEYVVHELFQALN